MDMIIVPMGKKMVLQHKDCVTKEEEGCFYGCCYSCEFYVSKDKKEIKHYHKWDKKKKNHVEITKKEFINIHKIIKSNKLRC